MTSRSFVRQLGFQPGTQLNPLQDNTDGTAPSNSDQVFGVVARLTRGRIDRAFKVNAGNYLAKTGPAESIRTNALNEAKLQISEALDNGGYEAVISRLVPAAAAKSFAVLNFSGTPAGSSNTTAFSVSPTVPVSNWSIYLMHHDCHNAGIKVALHADSTPVGGAAVAATEVRLRVLDEANIVLHEFEGSLDPAAKDDYGRSYYLPDVIARLTDSVELVVAAAATVPTTSDAYGRDAAGIDKWATSAVLACFAEGGTTYASTDYDRAITALRDTNLEFGGLISGGTQVTTLLGKLALLAIECNTPFKYDVDGKLSASAAITFQQSLAFDSHLLQGFWAPIEADDPMNGGRVTWGTAGLNMGYACARNARVNAMGFAPKNQPVAGAAYPLNRTGMRQLVQPSGPELSDLAKVQINPVLFQIYNGGSKFVFTDSLTTAKTRVSYKKLTSVAEMSVSIDAAVTMYSAELIQLPMRMYVKRMTAFLQKLLEDAVTSEWLVPSKNLPGNAPFSFTVAPSQDRPVDKVVVSYYTSYDGVARQAIVTQTLTS